MAERHHARVPGTLMTAVAFWRTPQMTASAASVYDPAGAGKPLERQDLRTGGSSAIW